MLVHTLTNVRKKSTKELVTKKKKTQNTLKVKLDERHRFVFTSLVFFFFCVVLLVLLPVVEKKKNEQNEQTSSTTKKGHEGKSRNLKREKEKNERLAKSVEKKS